MKAVAIFLIMILIVSFSYSDAFSQGMSRSNGLGLRLGFWNITGHPTRFSSTVTGSDVNVDIGGAGAWIYFFSRFYQNWFLEFNLGALGGIHGEQSQYLMYNVKATSVVPILFGLRYDMLSTRMPSSIQPYLATGLGSYWIMSTEETIIDPKMETQINIESTQKYGAYLGAGANILVTSWLALNFDLKYHFVDFQFERDFSGLGFSAGLSFLWGSKREIMQIKDIRLIVSDIYPAYYQFYNTYPLALVSVKNVAGYPIEVNVRSNIRPYSERPKDSGFIRIDKGKTVDIPVTAIFGSRLSQVSRRDPAILDVEVEARAGTTFKKQLSARMTVHTRNSWNGEMDKLGWFLTPDDEQVMKLSRDFVKEINYYDDTVPFTKAKIVFDQLQELGIHYRSDPNILFYQDDRVQYAMETIDQKGGDCDDLVILYASLLESLGIKTAFVETRDPEKEIAHLYLLFATGLTAEQGHLISSNEKRFVLRDKLSGQKEIWIPVETTLIEKGFEEAWKMGATEYLKDAIIRNGLEQGWVKVIDVR